MSASRTAPQDRFFELDGDRLARDGGKGLVIPAEGAGAEIPRGAADLHQGANAGTDLADG